MALKRKSKEIEGSESGTSKKQSITRNHGIKFKDPEQRNKYKSLISRTISPCRYPDVNAMNRLRIEENVIRLLNRLGLVEMLKPMRGFEKFTYEFLSSISFTKDRSKTNKPDHRVTFRLLNVDYEMSLEAFCSKLGLANAGYIHDSWDQTLRPTDYDPIAFWKSITGLNQYNSCSNKASNIHNLVLRYLQRVMICTIWGRKEVGMMRTDELFMLWAMLYNHLVNICYYLLDYLVSLAKKKPDDKGDIVVGGIITFIARKFGVGEGSGMNKIEGSIYLSLDTLTSMFFLKPHGYTHNFQFEWKVNNANCLIILPNPDITNPEVVENLLYVGSNPQVHNDGYDGGDEEEERWTWIQTEVQRISTEQQRQGVEISRLSNDVQRGNRMTEENNQMLRNMMQHRNLQCPPYGPQ